MSSNVLRFPIVAKANQEQRQHPDSTGIALKLVGAVLVFATLCTFGWPGLLLLLLAPMLL